MADPGGETSTRWRRLKAAWHKLIADIDDAIGSGDSLPVIGVRILWAILVFLVRAVLSPLGWLLEKLRKHVRWTAFVAALVSAAFIGAHPGWWLAKKFFTGDPCQRSHELRVVTTPDTDQVLRAEAAAFVAAQASSGCDVAVSVNSVDTFDDLRSAFASEVGAWKPEVQQVPLIPGPHPDIVIPALAAQAERLETIEQDGFTLVNEGSLASSDVVLAVPTAYEDVHSGELNAMLATAQRERLRVARPDPERSEAALLATQALYGPDAEREKLEARLSPADVRLDSAIAPFCRRDTDNIAIVLPRHAFEAFDNDRIPRSLCAGSELTDVDYMPVEIAGVPALDYPFIRVRWPGQANRERDELIGEFRTWLRDRLPSQGFEEPARANSGMSEEQYENTLTAYREARREIQVLFLLDNSGSMRRNVADGRSLDRGGRLIDRITDRLGDNDWAALWALPGEGRGGSSEQVAGGPVDTEQKRRLTNHVAALKLETGEYSPVYAGLVQAVRQTPDPENLTVILVTDGENRVRQGQPAEDLPLESAIAELAEAGTRLEVLAVAPEECSFEDLPKLPRQLDPGITTRCVPAAFADVDTLASEIIGRLRAGS